MTSLASAMPRAFPGTRAPGFFSRHLREISVAVAYSLLLAALALRQAGFFSKPVLRDVGHAPRRC